MSKFATMIITEIIGSRLRVHRKQSSIEAPSTFGPTTLCPCFLRHFISFWLIRPKIYFSFQTSISYFCKLEISNSLNITFTLLQDTKTTKNNFHNENQNSPLVNSFSCRGGYQKTDDPTNTKSPLLQNNLS